MIPLYNSASRPVSSDLNDLPDVRGQTMLQKAANRSFKSQISSCCRKRFEIVWGTANPEGAKRSRGPAARRARKKAPKQCPIPVAETIKASEESHSAVCGTGATDREERLADGDRYRVAEED